MEGGSPRQGELPNGVTMKAAHMEPYKPLQSHRKSTMHFDKGKPAFILEDPEGSTTGSSGTSCRTPTTPVKTAPAIVKP